MKRIVFDAGALIALERRDPCVLALLSELISSRLTAEVPAGVVGQVWRGSARQHAMARLLRTGTLRVEPMTEEVALHVGLLLASTGAKDVTDAHVALLAQKLNAQVVTSDPDDLRQLDATLNIVTV
ncbi:MAG: PIN domain-containing protein [Candidatus Dormibacteraceae bacterium]